MSELGGASANIEEELKKNGFFVSTTVGSSMQPMLRSRRDRVVIVPVEGRRLKKWELPLYRRADGKYVLHRVIGVKDGYYVIRGDNTYQKERVTDAQILGCVSEFYRGNTRVESSSVRYRIYARVWHWIFPLRLAALRLRVLAAGIKHKILKK